MKLEKYARLTLGHQRSVCLKRRLKGLKVTGATTGEGRDYYRAADLITDQAIEAIGRISRYKTSVVGVNGGTVWVRHDRLLGYIHKNKRALIRPASGGLDHPSTRKESSEILAVVLHNNSILVDLQQYIYALLEEKTAPVA